MTGRQLATGCQFDIVSASLSGHLVFSFPKSRSAAYAPAVAICKGAADYVENEIEGALIHFAAFANTRDDMARALALVNTLRGYKGLLIYAGGKLQDWARAHKVLECFADSAACNDRRAHCIISVHKDSITQRTPGMAITVNITPDFMTAKEDGKAYLFPCRLLAFSFGFKLQAGHPSSEEDQIQAGAVREGCSWCPNFNRHNGGD